MSIYRLFLGLVVTWPLVGFGQIDQAPAIVLGAGLQKMVQKCNPGPWGDLEYYYTYLEAPEPLTDLLNVPSERTVWRIPNKNADELRNFFLEAGLPGSEVEKLLSVTFSVQEGPPYLVYPTAQFVEALSPTTRSIIYSELCRWPENKYFRDPVIIESGNVAQWFSSSDLSQNTISQIERLSYKIGAATAFSDLPVLLTYLQSDVEERALVKAMTRTRSLILRLKINAGDDLEGLKRYWSAGFKSKDILPMFESISAIEDVERLDVAHLLPPTPRKYLYTFPSVSMGIEGMYPDGYWAALNFFNYLPNNRFSDLETAETYIGGFFQPVPLPTQFGDLMIIYDSATKRPKSACVYIADDIVYTKNGRSMLAPFVFMRIGDLLNRYSASSAVPTISYFRRNDR